MKHLVEAEHIQAVWLGHADRARDSTELTTNLATAIRCLDDQTILEALVDTCRMDVAVNRLPAPPRPVPVSRNGPRTNSGSARPSHRPWPRWAGS